MAEKLVLEKQICAACGVDVRPQALFCYNCGAAVAAENDLKTDGKTEVSDAWYRDGLTAGAKTTNLNEHDVPIQKPLDEPLEKPSDDLPETPAAADEKNPPPKQFERLKTAASMRQKNRVKTIPKKKVEVVWEQPETAPNVWFIIAAVMITAVAVGVLLAMLWIK